MSRPQKLTTNTCESETPYFMDFCTDLWVVIFSHKLLYLSKNELPYFGLQSTAS
jgi:hypothetical protein